MFNFHFFNVSGYTSTDYLMFCAFLVEAFFSRIYTSWLSVCSLGSTKLMHNPYLCEQMPFFFSMFLEMLLLTAWFFLHFLLKHRSQEATLVHNSCLCDQMPSFFKFVACFYWLLVFFYCILSWSIHLKKLISWLSECFLGSTKLVGNSCLCEQIPFFFSMFLAMILQTASCFLHFWWKHTSHEAKKILGFQNAVGLQVQNLCIILVCVSRFLFLFQCFWRLLYSLLVVLCIFGWGILL